MRRSSPELEPRKVKAQIELRMYTGNPDTGEGDHVIIDEVEFDPHGDDSPEAERHRYFVDHLIDNEVRSYSCALEDLVQAERDQLRMLCGLRVLVAGLTGRQRMGRGGRRYELDGRTGVFQGLDAGPLRGERLNQQEALWVRHGKVTAELPFHVNTAVHATSDLRAAADRAEVDWWRHDELYECPLYGEAVR